MQGKGIDLVEINSDVKNYYEEKYSEDKREKREVMEFVRSKRIISRYLSDTCMEIADVCGATGAYAFWLAEMGHRVHLLDLAENHIEIAKQKSRECGISLASYSCADARKLPYDDESMDMVLLMGALYHLREPASRMQCLKEARRILKRGGRLICTVMNRYNYLIASLKYSHLIESMGLEPIKQAFETGWIDSATFTGLPLHYGHTPEEIRSEMTDAGFSNIELTAVEGLANALGKAVDDVKDFDLLMECLDLVDRIPGMVGVTRNIIAAGVRV